VLPLEAIECRDARRMVPEALKALANWGSSDEVQENQMGIFLEKKWGKPKFHPIIMD
jgi:hypothetical protein